MFTNSPIKQAAERIWQRLFRTRAEDSLPHVVKHQRIYIVPTKRGLAFLLALLLMLIASVNYSLSLGYALSFILTGLFVATLLHTYRNLAGIHVENIQASHTFAGNDAVFTISVKNTLKETRHGIRLCTKAGSQIMTHIESKDTSDVLMSKPTLSRGMIELGRVTLQSDWPLGLWTCWTYVHAPINSLIYPKPETEAPPLPFALLEEDGSRSAAGTEGEVSGLRQYRPGDSIGSVSWKSVAKGIGMQVRTFDSNRSSTNAILNLDQTGHKQIEEQLSRLCSWVIEAHSKQGDFALQLPGETLATSRGEIHYQRAMEILALYGIDP